MPYITQDRRTIFDKHLEALAADVKTEGELNYCIYKLACLIARDLGPGYANYARCTSAMEHAKLEFYRKKLAPYEDEKIVENGDI